MKKVAILDYITSSVCIEPIPDNLEYDEEDYENDIEYWLSEMGYNLSNIDWMCFENEVPIFYGDDKKPICVL